MGSIFESLQKKNYFPSKPLKEELPLSQTNSKEQGLRRRLSALSLSFQPITSPTSLWAFRRSKSMSSIGESTGTSLRKWWDWGWAWILARKPTFVKDLEMNEEEKSMMGCHSKGSWRHVFYKVKSDLRRLVGSDRVGLPQTFRYDSYNYSKNFDDGNRSDRQD